MIKKMMYCATASKFLQVYNLQYRTDYRIVTRCAWLRSSHFQTCSSSLIDFNRTRLVGCAVCIRPSPAAVLFHSSTRFSRSFCRSPNRLYWTEVSFTYNLWHTLTLLAPFIAPNIDHVPECDHFSLTGILGRTRISYWLVWFTNPHADMIVMHHLTVFECRWNPFSLCENKNYYGCSSHVSSNALRGAM